MKIVRTAGLLTAFLVAPPLLAQQGGMQGMDHSKMQNDSANPYMHDEMDMHQKMMSAKGADASETWTRKMIEHHRGAIAMSRTALAKAADAKTKQYAQKAITAQTKEIAELQAWLRSHGKRPQ